MRISLTRSVAPLAAASWLGLVAIIALTAPGDEAKAVPAFARQTGEPCQVCHVGGLGPQLTPFGRNFKLHGYTLRTNPDNIPLAMMLQSSYTNTAKSNPAPPPGFGGNDNFALDQVSVFLAGGLGSHFGGFVQGTYDGVAKVFHWDQTDIRAVDDVTIHGVPVTFGASLNNSPGVQDPWNTLSSWGFPYTSSELAPQPTTQVLMNQVLAQEAIGLTGYTWINDQIYLEGGAYGSPGFDALSHLGVTPVVFTGAAPYARLAYQHDLGPGVAELGAFGLWAHLVPNNVTTTGFTDHYGDLGVDASYIDTLSNGDVAALNTRFTNEAQRLDASCTLAGAPLDSCAKNSVNDFRIDGSYYWRHRWGLTVQYFNTEGSPNSVIYAANRNFKPDSSGFELQADTTLFPDADSFNKRFNARVGVQYTGYTQFNGAGRNFDGLGDNAADQNTFRVFIWLMD